MSNASLRNFLLRKDFNLFVEMCFVHLNPGQVLKPNWHIDLLCDWAKQIMDGEKQRIIVALPPRSLKSLIFSVALPAFVLGRNPSTHILCASHNADLANKLSSDCRKVMTAEFYLEAFPGTRLSPLKNTEDYYETTLNGSRRAVSPNGGLTGLGGDILIVDDLVDAKDAHNVRLHEERRNWLHKSFFTRTNNANKTVQIVVGQRLSTVDYMGALIASGDYETLAISAIAQRNETYVGRDFVIERGIGDILHEEMMDEEELNRRRRAMTAADFSAQYLQEPIASGGGTLSWSWLKQFDKPPTDIVYFHSWDVARTPNGGDYTACVTLGYKNEKYFLKDIFRRQLDYGGVLNAMRDKIRRDKPAGVIIETSEGSGDAAYCTLRGEGVRNLHAFSPRESKEERVYQIVPVLEGGDLHIPADAAWLTDFRIEYLSFPSSKEHDDQLDALSQAIIGAPTLIRGAGRTPPRKYFVDMPQFRIRSLNLTFR